MDEHNKYLESRTRKKRGHHTLAISQEQYELAVTKLIVLVSPIRVIKYHNIESFLRQLSAKILIATTNSNNTVLSKI